MGIGERKRESKNMGRIKKLFFYWYSDHRDLRLSIRRQRQMCMRDRHKGDEGEHRDVFNDGGRDNTQTDSYTHFRAHETPEHIVCRLLLEKKKKNFFFFFF